MNQGSNQALLQEGYGCPRKVLQWHRQSWVWKCQKNLFSFYPELSFMIDFLSYCVQINIGRTSGSPSTCKDLGSCHSYLYKQEPNKVTANDFSWTYYGKEDAGKTTALNPGETGSSRKTQLRPIYLDWELLETQTGNNTLVVILVNCWRLSVDQQLDQQLQLWGGGDHS